MHGEVCFLSVGVSSLPLHLLSPPCVIKSNFALVIGRVRCVFLEQGGPEKSSVIFQEITSSLREKSPNMELFHAVEVYH